MAGAKLEKTRWPGIYRRGQRYVFEWTDAQGKRRRGMADTREEASTRKAAEETNASRGDLGERGPRARTTFASYALELFGATLEADGRRVRGRYAGRRGAIRDSTREDYRRQIERYWLPVLDKKALGKVTAPDLSRILAALATRDGDAYLADSSLRRIFAPVAALLATAAEEGLIAHNPARDVRVPTGRDALQNFDRDADDGDDPVSGRARALTHEQLASFLVVVDPRWRLFFELLASTGLRVSEAFALRWRDLVLDGPRPVARIRRAYVRGVYGPPKSRHGRRDVPISFRVVRGLRAHHASTEWSRPQDLVFPTLTGTAMDDGNLRHRTLKPAAEEVGVGWVGFHTFRHTCASMLIADGRNIVQVSRWLGHHSPSFTLDVYAHLMDEGVGDPLELGGDTSGSGSALRERSVALN
jgi:integrase